MKRRTIALGSTILLIALLVVGGTMAWFSDKEEATNEFTAGTVEIEVKEHGFVDLGNINPGDDETKNVSIKSKGSKQTYVRVALIPQWDSNNLSIDVVTLNTDTTNWIYQDGWYYYKKILKEGEESNLLLTSVKFHENMGDEYQDATFTVKVRAEAVQASHEAYKHVWRIDSLPEGVEPWNPTS